MKNRLFQNQKGLTQENGAEVFKVFLKLGLTSFGGPIAHLGYFRREFVEKRNWITEHQFAQLLALCQFLPGPASSQLGFSIGLIRNGWLGAFFAFFAFTAPSAILMFVFSLVTPELSGQLGVAIIQGLKIVALVVVAHGVFGMGTRLCPDNTRKIIAVLAALMMLFFAGAGQQLVVILFGGLAGALFLRDIQTLPEVSLPVSYGKRMAFFFLGLFFFFLGFLPVLSALTKIELVAVSEAFYRAGALVFGGGHVVLPFLEEAIVAPGWLSSDDFMTGYGAAQAVPGPMFSLAAYLGSHLPGMSGGVLGSVVALFFIFSPGFLLVLCALPLWNSLSTHSAASRVIAGINAAVVGLLAAALYRPVWVSAVQGFGDLLVASIGLILIFRFRASALYIVLWCVLARMLLSVLS